MKSVDKTHWREIQHYLLRRFRHRFHWPHRIRFLHPLRLSGLRLSGLRLPALRLPALRLPALRLSGLRLSALRHLCYQNLDRQLKFDCFLRLAHAVHREVPRCLVCVTHSVTLTAAIRSIIKWSSICDWSIMFAGGSTTFGFELKLSTYFWIIRLLRRVWSLTILL